LPNLGRTQCSFKLGTTPPGDDFRELLENRREYNGKSRLRIGGFFIRLALWGHASSGHTKAYI